MAEDHCWIHFHLMPSGRYCWFRRLLSNQSRRNVWGVGALFGAAEQLFKYGRTPINSESRCAKNCKKKECCNYQTDHDLWADSIDCAFDDSGSWSRELPIRVIPEKINYTALFSYLCGIFWRSSINLLVVTLCDLPILCRCSAWFLDQGIANYAYNSP